MTLYFIQLLHRNTNKTIYLQILDLTHHDLSHLLYYFSLPFFLRVNYSAESCLAEYNLTC